MDKDDMELIEHIDMGDEVLCDSCNKDYTHSDEVGGAQFGSYAVCPDCVGQWIANSSLGERAAMVEAKPGQTFRDFVINDLRGGKSGEINIYRG